MDIFATIREIKYQKFLEEKLGKIDFAAFDINSAPSSVVVYNGNKIFTVSKWVSAKRTRSYPYARVYNTLSATKRLTVIPVVKDEGINGDRDMIQWDTISLMSLLDVYVIFAYYSKAVASKRVGKITEQQFDVAFVNSKIEEIGNYHSSALHWNVKETKNIGVLVEKVKEFYSKIEKDYGVKPHASVGLDKFQEKFLGHMDIFMNDSRKKAGLAQNREYGTVQPKEILKTVSKAKITIMNYLGGKYFFTVDEVRIEGDSIFLIESKCTKNGLLPSIDDIKDGLLKMILYSNFHEVFVDEKKFNHIPVLHLNSPNLKGSVSSKKIEELPAFIDLNKLQKDKPFLDALFKEAVHNKFEVIISL